MKWITHQTGAALGALALGMPWPGIAAALAGGIFPDVIDQKISGLGPTRKSRQKIFNNIHRGPSHWFGWWLGLLLAVLTVKMPELARHAGMGFAFGALSHVCLDMLTPQGVPLRPFSRQGKLAAPICSTGKGGEYLFLLIMLACGAFYFKNDLNPALAAVMRYF